MKNSLNNNLLLFNISVDSEDHALAFSISWIRELSKYFNQINVITLSSGSYKLPDNCKVYSIKKQNKLLRAYNFLKTLNSILKNTKIHYCFSHMNLVFVVLSGILLRIKGIPITLWYAHPSKHLILKIAYFFTNKVVTSFKKTFPYESSKVYRIGQGIDPKVYYPLKNSKSNRILYLGRISKSKNIEYLIEEMKFLNNYKLDIYGPTSNQNDIDYLNSLKNKVKLLKLYARVRFMGPISWDQTNKTYSKYKYHINLTGKGFGDKTALESMMCSVCTLIANKDLKEMVTPYEDYVFFEVDKKESLSNKIKNIDLKAIDYEISQKQRHNVLKYNSLDSLINNLQKIIKS